MLILCRTWWYRTVPQSANIIWCNWLFLFSLCSVRGQCHQIYCKFFIHVPSFITCAMCCVLCWWCGQCLGWYWQEAVQCLTYSSVYGLPCANTIRGASESSRIRSTKKCWLNLLNFVCHLFQNSLPGNVYKDLLIFFPCFKSTMEDIFLIVQYRLRIPLDVRYCFKTSSFQFHFQFGKQQNHRGLSPMSWWDGEQQPCC
jgi:hypothetical protein